MHCPLNLDRSGRIARGLQTGPGSPESAKQLLGIIVLVAPIVGMSDIGISTGRSDWVRVISRAILVYSICIYY